MDACFSLMSFPVYVSLLWSYNESLPQSVSNFDFMFHCAGDDYNLSIDLIFFSSPPGKMWTVSPSQGMAARPPPPTPPPPHPVHTQSLVMSVLLLS